MIGVETSFATLSESDPEGCSLEADSISFGESVDAESEAFFNVLEGEVLAAFA